MKSLALSLLNTYYKPGQAEISQDSYSLLSKVKEVIARMGAEKVKVEGHTDTIGSKILNKNLSQARAEGVAQYLSSDKLIGKSMIEAEGLGFEKPISPNNTSQGRSENRRVDIIVSPGQIQTE